ncbi:MAG: response regulator [Planctomycetaceae bacterium]|nr:response regulator [Planctomycetaceae bacterium]
MEIHAMVVDDSGIMRKMVMRNLMETRLANFSFTEAADGLDAIKKLPEKPVDMMFVDWNMPNMTGIELVMHVRQNQKRHVPIVMVTTEGTMGKVEEALDKGGVDCYIVKPFTKDIMIQKLQPLFERLNNAQTIKPGGFFSKLAKLAS